MLRPFLAASVIAGIVLACTQYSCHKPARTKPAVTVEKPESKPDTTCHCGKRCCSDPTVWNWYVEPKRNQLNTGSWYWERDKDQWSWVFYPDNQSAVPPTVPAGRPAPFQAPARGFFYNGAACNGPGCRS